MYTQYPQVHKVALNLPYIWSERPTVTYVSFTGADAQFVISDIISDEH